MKILAVSDVVNKFLYSPRVKQIAGDVDAIVSCGDLPTYYLDYLVTMLGKPLLYVCGNHDKYSQDIKSAGDFLGVPNFKNSKYDYNQNKYFGGENLDNKSYCYKDTIFSGLEGSFRYNRGEHQYTERQMQAKIMRMFPGLLWNKMSKGRFVDVMVTHAPPFGIHDKDDRPHRGFEGFRWIIETMKPKYLLHGHIHIYDRRTIRETKYIDTQVINVYDYRILDLDLGSTEDDSKTDE